MAEFLSQTWRNWDRQDGEAVPPLLELRIAAAVEDYMADHCREDAISLTIRWVNWVDRKRAAWQAWQN